MIETTFTVAQAEALFNQEGVAFGNKNGFPVFRAVELFGRAAAEWLEAGMKMDGYIAPGAGFNVWGDVDYLTFTGFLKLITWHNCIILERMSAESEGGKIWADVWAKRIAQLDARDAEEARMQEEAKAKRAAARKAKKAAQQKQEKPADGSDRQA